MPTLAEIAQVRQIPLTSGILDAVKKTAPALLAFDTRTSSTTKFQTLALVSLPTASGFKDYGEGATHAGAGLALREFDAKLMVAKVQAEQITAARWDAENSASGETYFDMQVNARMAAEMRHLERTIFYGTVQDAKGFPGLKQLTPYASSNVLSLTADPADYDYTRSVVNAGGSTSSTASSVYSITFGPMDCQLVACNDQGGELFGMTEPIRQHLAPDSASPNATLEYLISQITGHFGVSVSGMNQSPNSVVPTQYSVRRLANVTADSNCTLDDKKLERLVTSHSEAGMPDLLVMSQRSYNQWRDSRSATTTTVFIGGGGDAVNTRGNLTRELQSFEGIRIVTTSAVRNNDAIES